MNLHDSGLSLVWSLLGFGLYLPVLVWALKTAPWHKISDKPSQHVFLGATVIVFLTWNSVASIGPGLGFHLLLAALVTLMFGAQFALMSLSIALLGISILGSAGWMAFGLNALIMAVIPVLVVWRIAVWSYQALERNFFVFILLNGFLAASISVIAASAVAALVMAQSGLYTLEVLERSFIPYIPLIAIPEGFVNGVLILALVIMKPQWVSCFTDEQYLKGK
ncbi:hypothetical protein CYQ88_07645 [Hydrogenovibrio sp. SC-1]|uniref:energy-coupling factor ABC transporter permease n=1 Tax=Hydrogenovibrio sp. SC-1 TaxID=2065820 RepID=UPI000C7D40E7|nr:energy-coupling factor ABC transporter permease [Hydrogenovibrio sp. SC-1]PLA74105.1 hypothetical protein CYQ88_07645 [Hydrogenovibrio sp. SC-1]